MKTTVLTFAALAALASATHAQTMPVDWSGATFTSTGATLTDPVFGDITLSLISGPQDPGYPLGSSVHPGYFTGALIRQSTSLKSEWRLSWTSSVAGAEIAFWDIDDGEGVSILNNTATLSQINSARGGMETTTATNVTAGNLSILNPTPTYDSFSVPANHVDFAFEGANSLNAATISLVPEPSSTALLGLAGLGLTLRRKRS